MQNSEKKSVQNPFSFRLSIPAGWIIQSTPYEWRWSRHDDVTWRDPGARSVAVFEHVGNDDTEALLLAQRDAQWPCELHLSGTNWPGRPMTGGGVIFRDTYLPLSNSFYQISEFFKIFRKTVDIFSNSEKFGKILTKIHLFRCEK